MNLQELYPYTQDQLTEPTAGTADWDSRFEHFGHFEHFEPVDQSFEDLTISEQKLVGILTQQQDAFQEQVIFVNSFKPADEATSSARSVQSSPTGPSWRPRSVSLNGVGEHRRANSFAGHGKLFQSPPSFMNCRFSAGASGDPSYKPDYPNLASLDQGLPPQHPYTTLADYEKNFTFLMEDPSRNSRTSDVLQKRHSVATPNVYCCPWPNCNKVFNRFYNLRSHYRIHSGEKPYICGFCDAAFARNHDLKRHERIHSNTKPFVCNSCSKSFSRNDALNRHCRLANCSKFNEHE